MPYPEGPQGPDEEGSGGRPDPAVGPSFAWGVEGILWGFWSLWNHVVFL